MEKQFPARARARSSRKFDKWPFFLVLSSFALLYWLYRGQEAEWPSFGVPSGEPDEFSWSEVSREINPIWPTYTNSSQVSPSKELVFSSCFEGYECAKLIVPLDWNSTGSASHVTIAVIKIPAPVSVTDHRYGGPIVINPGEFLPM